MRRLEKYLGHASLDSRRMNLKYILGGFFIVSVGVVVFWNCATISLDPGCIPFSRLQVILKLSHSSHQLGSVHCPGLGPPTPPWVHIQVILVHLLNGPPPMAPHTYFPGYFNLLFCEVFHIVRNHHHRLNPFLHSPKYSPKLPLQPLFQAKPLSWPHAPRYFDLWGGGAEESWQNRPVFHQFIWHLKSNYTNMLRCKTRAHCM